MRGQWIAPALVLLLAAPASAQRETALATMSLVAAIIGGELQVRPVPLLELELVRVADTSIRMPLRTGLDGRVTHAVEAGNYRLRSLAPIRFGSVAYTWNLAVELRAGETLAIELTNANATADSSTTRGGDAAMVERLRRGVLRIDAGLSRGTGFLVDTMTGLVVTNHHVLATDSNVSVFVDSATRVAAQIVALDRAADLAILRLPTEVCGDCPRLRLATARPALAPGDRVIAIGFSGRRSRVTYGTVSEVRDSYILSDLSVKPGNSGGPLLSAAGDVVGITTFGADAPATAIAGAMTVERLAPLLQQAAGAAEPAPPLERLPVMPAHPYRLAALRAYADTLSPKAYTKLWELSAGPFNVALGTPVLDYVVRLERERQMSRARRQREESSGVAEQERYQDLIQEADWTELSEDVTAPILSFLIHPKTGRGFWNKVAGNWDKARFKFKGDVRGAALYRNGTLVSPVIGGHSPERVYIDESNVVMKDVADVGFYAYLPEVLAPDSLGVPPRIELVVQDLKRPDRAVRLVLQPKVVAMLWNDFEPYFREAEPERRFVRAVASK